jgi:hypothetical protein
MNIALLNLAGLAIEIVGVAILMNVDSTERNVLDAQVRRDSAHRVSLQNADHNISRRYLDGPQGQEDERTVSSYDPRLGSKRIRLALKFLVGGMLLQLVAALVQASASNA